MIERIAQLRHQGVLPGISRRKLIKAGGATASLGVLGGFAGISCEPQPTVTPRPKTTTPASPTRIVTGPTTPQIAITVTREPTLTAELRKQPVTLVQEDKTSIKYGAFKNGTKMVLLANRQLMDQMCEDPKYKPLQIGVHRNVGVSVIFTPGAFQSNYPVVTNAELQSLRNIHEIEQGFDMDLYGVGFRVDQAFLEVLKRNVPQSFYTRALSEELSIGWVGSMIKGVDIAYGVQGGITFPPEQLSLITSSASLPIDLIQVPQEYWDKAKAIFEGKPSVNY